jgi:transcriptional regulator of acetoin/glycerol metabolism
MHNLKPADAADQLQLARRRFFGEGGDPGVLVPEPIARSWKRCIAVPLQGSVPAEPLPRQELFSRREAQGRLRQHALPELEALAEALVPSRVIVLLADPQGMVLDAAGSDAFMTKAQRVALMPGVEWSENSRGTNAIGTALTDGVPVSVVGAQHYLEQNAALGCTATPLLAPDGSVMGVLDVSGDPRCIQAQTVGLVRMAGQMIEHRLALDIMPSQTEVLRFAHDPALLGSHREALLWIRNGVLVGANRAALRVLGMTLEQLRDRFVEDLFRTLPSTLRDASRLELQPHLMQPGRYTSWSAGWVQQKTTVQVGAAREPAVAPVAAALDVAPVRAGAPLNLPIIGDAAREVQLARAVRVLDSGIPVLVTGESGVGKEVFARQMHRLSGRARAPFVAVNCAAVPEGLIEAELFGYEEGAFTGARRRGQAGLIKEADGGVLFLDEIGDMPLMLQARLLRVLQDHEVKPLGGGRAQAVDFVLVCATHRRLDAMAAAGTFRADLYYRLQHFTVELPALREQPDRRDRIDELLGGMLAQRNASLSAQAREALLGYSWPGNWRQLVAVCQTLLALTEPGARIELADVPEDIRRALRGQTTAPPRAEAPACAPAGMRQADLRSLADSAIEAAIQSCGGNISRAARLLGVHRSTLYRHKR